jgi:hypothetical protein
VMPPDGGVTRLACPHRGGNGIAGPPTGGHKRNKVPPPGAMRLRQPGIGKGWRGLRPGTWLCPSQYGRRTSFAWLW